MEVQVYNGGTLAVSDVIFDVPFKEPLVHQIVTAYLAAGRAGTKAQKTRSQVSGGGAKPFRQKGTGRARAGTIRSPIWRTGGKAFAATPRSYAQKVNKKMYRGAMRSIFAELLRQNRLIIVEEFSLEQAKTKLLVAKLKEMNLTKTLILTAEYDERLYLAARNLPFVEALEFSYIDPVSLISFEHIVITKQALTKVEESLS